MCSHEYSFCFGLFYLLPLFFGAILGLGFCVYLPFFGTTLRFMELLVHFCWFLLVGSTRLHYCVMRMSASAAKQTIPIIR